MDMDCIAGRAPVIGLAGPSCSGKSTVARIVADTLGAKLFHLDAYWVHGVARPIVNGAPSFERPHQYDGAAMAADIRRWQASHPGTAVVAEGFLLFMYEDLFELCDLRMFMTIPDAVAAARRQARALARGDAASGGKPPAIERAWMANGLAEWRRYGAMQADLPGLVMVNALESPYAIAGLIAATVHRPDAGHRIAADMSCWAGIESIARP